jgi:NADH-quinone oxidoreductase subunit G
MVRLTIDGQAVDAIEGQNILLAAKSIGIEIPTLCYLSGVNEIGACRVCVVEIEGVDRLTAACNTEVGEGIRVLTNSPKVRRARKTNVQFLLSRHCCQCLSCVRNGNCALQSLAADLGIHEQVYKEEYRPMDWDKTLPLIRDGSKCVQCLRCVQICDNVQGLGCWNLVSHGSYVDVGLTENTTLEKTACALCGQCVTHCPTGALTARDDTDAVLDALANPDVITAVQVAPAVRAAWAETLGLSREDAAPGKMAAALRRIGFDYVFDTDFAADLTIMEEGMEFIQRVIHAETPRKYPMFTSCCPGWVRFLKGQYPDMADCLSSAKSPQQMFGAVAKTYFAKTKNIDPGKLFLVSVMPCVAKKHEAALEVMNSAGAGQDVDAVLTTREFVRLLRASHVNFAQLPQETFDEPLGESTGAAVIFGTTGGVMEAALRTVYCVLTGEKPPETEAFKAVRGVGEGWSEACLTVAGREVRVAVANGLKNVRNLIEAIRCGEARYDFVEIMACPGGCAGGGGQPIAMDTELAGERSGILFKLDSASKLRYSHENPSVQRLYSEFLEQPLSHKAHALLHSDHEAWKMPCR